MEEQPPWRALQAFHCSHNCISSMDPSLRLLPALQVACPADRMQYASISPCCFQVLLQCQTGKSMAPHTAKFLRLDASHSSG